MVLFLVATIAAIAFTVLLAIWGGRDYEWHNLIATITSAVLGIASTIALIVIICFAWGWESSKYQAEIINREYRTEYSQAEIFYASNVINTIRELDRKRIEINGDLMKK
jgi:hypothetical protein